MPKKFLVKTIIETEVWDLVESNSIPDAVAKVESTQQDPFVYVHSSSWVKSVIEVDSWEVPIRDFHPTITENYIEALVNEVVLK